MPLVLFPTFVSISKSMKTTRVRNTVARTTILELVTASRVALSQPDIQQALNGLCDRVTIYRVLDRLTDEGLIHRIVNVNGVVNYASCHTCAHRHDHRHIHFSCRVCHSLTCLEQVVPTFSLPDDFTQEETFFTISGICNQCSSTSTQAS